MESLPPCRAPERPSPSCLIRSSAVLPTARKALVVAMLLGFTCVAQADSPELFVADPALLDDFTESLPDRGKSQGYEYAIIQGLAILEGDIVLGSVDENGSLDRRGTTRGLARNDAFGRWPDGIIPYVPPNENSPTQQVNIRLAIDHWMENTRITFVERTEENAADYPNYIRFNSSNSCASYVGMQGGEQPVMVSDGCTTGSIIHELGHAIGLFHEHTRSDRDSFIQVNWDQIVDGKDINFKVQNVGTSNYGPYDYGSIMHYGEYFFSKSSQPTLVVPDGVEIGQRVALSPIDASSVDEMYATDLAVMPPSSTDGDTGLELGMTVYNQGELGAHELQLVVRIADDTQWLGVSDNSGWQCLNYDSELRCTRPTLAEGRESRFSILVDPGSGGADDVRLLLTSRTLDSNPSNNSYNDDGSLSAEPSTTDPDTLNKNIENDDQSSPTPVEETPMTSAPPVAAAEGTDTKLASAGGAAHAGALLALFALITWRERHRQHTRSTPGKVR